MPVTTSPAPLPSKLHLKVCGLKHAENILEVADLEPDFIGFIFYPESKRFVGEGLDSEVLRSLPPTVRKVGVFVNESTAGILRRGARYGLDLAQLHGTETPAQCAELWAAGLGVIKAFTVGEAVDFAALEPYVPYCNYFLFDAPGEQPGGNGTSFTWELLRRYHLPVPYLLAGGLGPEQGPELAQLELPGLYGLDLNSRFETAPGQKNSADLRRFVEALRAAELARPPAPATGQTSQRPVAEQPESKQ